MNTCTHIYMYFILCRESTSFAVLQNFSFVLGMCTLFQQVCNLLISQEHRNKTFT